MDGWCKYLREFSKTFEISALGSSGAWGKLIHEKTWGLKSRNIILNSTILYRYTWYLKRVMAGLPYNNIYFFNTYIIESRIILNFSSTFLDSQHIFRKLCQKLDFNKIIFCSIIFKVSAWLSHHTVCKIGLKKQGMHWWLMQGSENPMGRTVDRSCLHYQEKADLRTRTRTLIIIL